MSTEGGMGLESYLDCGCGCGGLKKSDTVKLKFAMYSGIVFFLIANPVTYKVTSGIFGGWIASGGCPTTGGLLFHTVVFILVVFMLMKIRT